MELRGADGLGGERRGEVEVRTERSEAFRINREQFRLLEKWMSLGQIWKIIFKGPFWHLYILCHNLYR